VALINSNMQQTWVKGSDGKLQTQWKVSQKNPEPVLKEPEDQIQMSTPQERQDEIDEMKLQEAMQKLQALNSGQLRRIDFSDEILDKKEDHFKPFESAEELLIDLVKEKPSGFKEFNEKELRDVLQKIGCKEEDIKNAVAEYKKTQTTDELKDTFLDGVKAHRRYTMVQQPDGTTVKAELDLDDEKKSIKKALENFGSFSGPEDLTLMLKQAGLSEQNITNYIHAYQNEKFSNEMKALKKGLKKAEITIDTDKLKALNNRADVGLFRITEGTLEELSGKVDTEKLKSLKGKELSPGTLTEKLAGLDFSKEDTEQILSHSDGIMFKLKPELDRDLSQVGYENWQINQLENEFTKNTQPKVGLNVMKNTFTDFSKDGIIQKAPQAAVLAAQIAMCIVTGSLVPPMIPMIALSLSATAIEKLLLKDYSNRVQQKAQAKALAEASGIEPQYAQKIVEMQAKAAEQQKQLNKFTTKAMKNEEMNEWVTGLLKDAENEQALGQIEAGQNVEYNGLKEKFFRMIGKYYKPEEAQARALFLELMLRGVIVGDKDVMTFLETQPEKRQEAVKEKAAELKQSLIEQQKAREAEEAQAAQNQVQGLSQQQQIAFIKSFTDDFMSSQKMKEFAENVAFKDQPEVLANIYNDKTDEESQQLRASFALSAFTKGIMDKNPEVLEFTRALGQKYDKGAITLLDNLVATNVEIMKMKEQGDGAEIQETTEISATGGLSDQEKMATLKAFTKDFLGDKKMEDFTRNIAFKEQPQIADAIYNPQIPVENKMDPVMAAFTLGILDENPDVIAFNDSVTPKYQGAKEEFLSDIVTQKAELINQQRAAVAQ